MQSQIIYRRSFIMQSIAQFLITGIEFLAVWALFNRFHSMAGWYLTEVALFHGWIHMIFALSDANSRGFDLMSQLIKTGELDRYLLRPAHPLIQIAGKEFTLRRSGRFLQGFIIFIWALTQLSIQWNLVKVGLLIVTYLSGVALFNGIFIIQATSCFWTIESVEIANTLTYGGVEAGRMPMSIYPPYLRQFFTFVVPLACISYYPWLFILNKPDPIGLPGWLALISPLFCLVFFLFSIGFWEFGLRSYTSAGG